MTILAYVTKQSLAAEYEVAKKCLEIMDETTTRLSFEFEARLRIILFGLLWLMFFREYFMVPFEHFWPYGLLRTHIRSISMLLQYVRQ